MSDLEGVISTAHVSEVLAVAKRLAGLPESGKGALERTALERIDTLGDEAIQLEDGARNARLRMRSEVKQLLERLRASWADEEIEAATGYSLTEKLEE
jgi:hypothetical protein